LLRPAGAASGGPSFAGNGRTGADYSACAFGLPDSRATFSGPPAAGFQPPTRLLYQAGDRLLLPFVVSGSLGFQFGIL